MRPREVTISGLRTGSYPVRIGLRVPRITASGHWSPPPRARSSSSNGDGTPISPSPAMKPLVSDPGRPSRWRATSGRGRFTSALASTRPSATTSTSSIVRPLSRAQAQPLSTSAKPSGRSPTDGESSQASMAPSGGKHIETCSISRTAFSDALPDRLFRFPITGQMRSSYPCRSTIVGRLAPEAQWSEVASGSATPVAHDESVPVPPPELVHRVGTSDMSDFRSKGGELKQRILALLPEDWSFEGKRVLDFGCGIGRLLRHFLPESRTCELHGCDIDADSIDWLQRHLSPPLHFRRNEEVPPLSYAAETFDLVIATSVFTHIADAWSDWLVEMHRILRPDGLLVASFLGEKMVGTFGERWDDDRIGMNVLRPHQSWELGGPMVLHSSWWLAEHWGRAFDLVRLDENGLPPHGAIVARKQLNSVTAAQIERIDPTEPRELLALRHNIAQLGRESHEFQARATWLEGELARVEREHAELDAAYRRTLEARLRRTLRRVWHGSRRMPSA